MSHFASSQNLKGMCLLLKCDMRHAMWEVLRLIVVCNKRYHKKTTLQDLDAQLDLLRTQVRISKQLGYIDFKKYEYWARLNNEIGCMIGGWIKAFA